MDSKPAHVSLYVSRELREAIGRSAAENDRLLRPRFGSPFALTRPSPRARRSPYGGSTPERTEKP